MTDKCPFQFDLMNPMTYHEKLPFEAFATLRQQCPVSYQSGAAEHGGDFWAITRREDLDIMVTKVLALGQALVEEMLSDAPDAH